ncbi:MAG: hypothetical protein ACYC3S_16345, partial [Chloroflexota bacterium]
SLRRLSQIATQGRERIMQAKPGYYLVCLALLAVVPLSGCGSPAPATPTPTPPPTVTVVASPTPVPTATSTTTATGATVLVGNTGGDGVWIRKTLTASDRIRSWVDGTKMTVVGADQTAEGRVWKNVKDPAGNVGWVPTQYLIPAPSR